MGNNVLTGVVTKLIEILMRREHNNIIIINHKYLCVARRRSWGGDHVGVRGFLNLITRRFRLDWRFSG